VVPANSKIRRVGESIKKITSDHGEWTAQAVVAAQGNNTVAEAVPASQLIRKATSAHGHGVLIPAQEAQTRQVSILQTRDSVADSIVAKLAKERFLAV
jgi:hypothetical protein